MRCFGVVILSLMLIVNGALANSEGAPATTTETKMGMTIHGDEAAAVGLYLMPWSNENLSDIDRPPRLLKEEIAEVDMSDFKRQAEWDQARREYQIWRLQRNNW